MIVIVVLLAVILGLIALLSVGAVATQAGALAAQSGTALVVTCTMAMMVFVALGAGVTIGTHKQRQDHDDLDQEDFRPRSPRITRPRQPQMPYPQQPPVYFLPMPSPFQGMPVPYSPQDRQFANDMYLNDDVYDPYDEEWSGW